MITPTTGNSPKLPPPAKFSLPGAVFHRDGQPEVAVRISCGKLRSTRDTRALAGVPNFDSSEGWNLLFPKKPCHSSESWNLILLLLLVQVRVCLAFQQIE